MLSKLAEVRKAVAAAVGGVLTVLNFTTNNFGTFLPPQWSAALGALIAVLGVAVTYLVPNKPAEDDA